MPEKDDVNEKPVDDGTASTEDKKAGNQSTPAVRNPFEDGIKDISPEEMESVEQFKEAQTERD